MSKHTPRPWQEIRFSIHGSGAAGKRIFRNTLTGVEGRDNNRLAVEAPEMKEWLTRYVEWQLRLWAEAQDSGFLGSFDEWATDETKEAIAILKRINGEQPKEEEK